MTRSTRTKTNISHVEHQRHLPVECQWIHRFVRRKSYRIAVLLIICLLNVVDLFVDWYFFMSKATIQQGLVFGPPRPKVLMAMFVFCIISTFTSLLEVIQIIRDTRQNRLTSLFGQITNCLTLWLEDVPFLTLNLLIVICRDGEVTYISIAKAVIGIIAAFIRFISILLNKWLIRHDYQRKDNLSQFFNTISTIGVIIVFIFSISIHIIASLPIDHYGRIHLERPSDFTHFKFAHQKYFDGVGVFLHSPYEFNKYIYLTEIENIIQNGQATFGFSLNQKDNLFCIKQSNQTSCFVQTNVTNISLYDQPLTNKIINYSIVFQFKQPDFYYLLGDIQYNIKRCDLKDYHIDDSKFLLQYFRLKRNFNQTKSPMVFNEQTNMYRYYDDSNDFESLASFWRTGLSRCSSTSTFNPHRSNDIPMIDCE